jgi:phosphinothricin acetyltransferase
VPAVHIRHANPAADASACAALYAPSVNDGVASLELQAPSPGEMRLRIEHVCSRHPWLVAELDGRVVGYAYATEHRERWAYRWATDTSVYVSDSHRRRGVGRALYGALLPLLVAQGFYIACAGITLPNPASVALHESFGYEPVGTYRKIGFKNGRWWGVGWWQAQLREQPDGAAPARPRPPARLADIASGRPGC